MRRSVGVCLAVIAAAVTPSQISLAHDLVTAPAQLDPSSLPKTPTEVEQGQENVGRSAAGESAAIESVGDRRPSALLLDVRSGFGLPLGEARTFATGRGAADVAFGYLSEWGRYAGVTAGVSELDSSLSGFHETTFQFGVDLGYRPKVRGKIEPWVGLGFAWQILWLTKADFYMKAVGPQFPIVRLGADYRFIDGFAMGPFAAFAYRRYDPFSVEGQTPLELMRVTGRDAWIVVGVSATLGVSRP